MFELFFNSEIIDYFVNESQKYAQFTNQPGPKIIELEIKCFLVIMSGYNSLPSKRMYWDVKEAIQ